MDFKEYIFFLYTNVMLGLGLLENPLTKQKEENVQLAEFTIKILDMIKEKTEGNLTDEEKSFLDTHLADAKMKYLEVASVKNSDKKKEDN